MRAGDQDLTVSLVEYTGTFPGQLGHHGNRKLNDVPYQRTSHDILSAIDNLVKTMPPKHIYNKLVQESSEESEAPRDLKQIYNRKSTRNFQRAQRNNTA